MAERMQQVVLGLAASGINHLLPSTAALPTSTALALENMTNKATINYTTSESGNPFIPGWYADPDTEYYNNLYWVFPTSSLPYEQQTYLDAFSSPDLVHWTKHPRILTTDDIPWAHKALWAPSPISRNGKYYLYFGANDILVDEIANGLVGGIGVAVADKPEGPYRDAIGKPLIGDFHNGAQPIDQDVFIDPVDGQAYMFYGGHSHANVVKLNEDMVSLGSFGENENGTAQEVFREITPRGYTEGSQMVERNGVYYLMWSEGGWTGPDYSVSYGMSRTGPLGPFEFDGFPEGNRILQQDGSVARGSGHNGVINVPGTDVWFMVYHRRPLSETDGNHRVVCYDRLEFDEEGHMRPVRMLVKDDFEDGNMVAWKQFEFSSGGGNGASEGKGLWDVVEGRLTGSRAGSDKGVSLAMLDTNFGDMVFDATVALPAEGGNESNAQLIFRAQGTALTTYAGFYAAVVRSDGVQITSYINGTTKVLAATTRGGPGSSIKFTPGKEYPIRVTAVAADIKVFVGENKDAPVLTATDSNFTAGANGVGISGTVAGARFGYISVAHAS